MFRIFTKSIEKLKQYLNPISGYDPDSVEAGKIRAKQISSLANLTSSMMFMNLICALTAFLVFKNLQHDWFLGIWTSCLCLLAFVGIIAADKNKKLGARKIVSKKACSKAAMWAAVLGGLWAILPVFLYPDLPVEQQGILIAIISGMMGGGALTLYVVPRAMISWLGVMTVGSISALIVSGTYESYVLMCLLLVYSGALAKAGWTMALTFIKAELSHLEIAKQADTIGLLLRDFSGAKGDWLWETDKAGEIVVGGKEFAEVFGFELSSFSTDHLNRPKTGSEEAFINQRSLDALCEHFEKQSSFRDVIIFARGTKQSTWMQLSAKPMYNIRDKFVGYRGVASDISETKLAEERIAHLAHNDALTGLTNREKFSHALDDKIRNFSSDQYWTILYLDLDGFKNINDDEGHSVGDRLLVEVASRLRKAVSSTDLVARLGGDEFAILCNSAQTTSSVCALADKLIDTVSEPYQVDGYIVEIGLSIGIAIGGKDGCETHTLLKNADLALYRAKSEGKGVYRFYQEEMDEIVKERRNLESELRNAVKNNQLSLLYQPLVSSETGQTTGFEALVRWNHPVRGIISPSDFIPVAEKLGIVKEVGDWVLQSACREASLWPENLTVSVNLSPQQFKDCDVIGSVTTALANSKLDPKRLEVEITEGLFIDNTEEALFVLRELKSMGVNIAMDDFGTGYSSLSHILKFPFDKLKIDRSLITTISEDTVAKNMLEAIMKLGNILNLQITAEGVETEMQERLLKEMDCSHFQGFHFGRPLSNSELSAYLLKEIDGTLKQNAGSIPVDDIISPAGKTESQ